MVDAGTVPNRRLGNSSFQTPQVACEDTRGNLGFRPGGIGRLVGVAK